MTVRTERMIAISVTINLGSVAVISRRTGIASGNQRAHDPPMIATPPADDCRSLHLATKIDGSSVGSRRLWFGCLDTIFLSLGEDVHSRGFLDRLLAGSLELIPS
jgi:hypothetical protein